MFFTEADSTYIGPFEDLGELQQPAGASAFVNVYYLHLNARDTDTLRIERTPKDLAPGDYPNRVRLRYFYNGRPCGDYDLAANPALRDQFQRTPHGQIVTLRKFGR